MKKGIVNRPFIGIRLKRLKLQCLKRDQEGNG